LRSIDILKKLWFLFKLFSKADSEKIDSNCLGKRLQKRCCTLDGLYSHTTILFAMLHAQ
jgi:hypothetical protein